MKFSFYIGDEITDEVESAVVEERFLFLHDVNIVPFF